jgi:hypothetical protein
VRHDKTVNDADSLNGREAESIPDGGILAALPRTRPQRATARRTAARGDGPSKALATKTSVRARAGKGQKQRPAKTQKPAETTERKPVTTARRKPTSTTTRAAKAASAPAKPSTRAANATAKSATQAAKTPARTSKRTVKAPTKSVEPPTPKQGYEPEEEVELGATVHPPSGAELVESVADIVGELAGSSLAAGGRLLKDAFSLLRRP